MDDIGQRTRVDPASADLIFTPGRRKVLEAIAVAQKSPEGGFDLNHAILDQRPMALPVPCGKVFTAKGGYA